MFVAVTVSPDWLVVAFQAPVIFWSPGKVKPRFQPLIADVPWLVITTFAVKPPPHCAVVWYCTEQPPLGVLLAEADGEADAEADGDAEAEADADAEADAEAEAEADADAVADAEPDWLPLGEITYVTSERAG